ncbi:lysostaphin resistance A-like protein [Lactococcus lactis]|uniref:CPBP family intramembrane glutamic endopeptidase n=1 Tax=Lactococcus lactis TaxID=1358 RepID=UPI003F867226
MNWKTFFKTAIGMWGTFLFYKIITLLLLYIFPNLQEKPFYEFIYFAIVFVITLFILKMSTKIFNKKIVINPVKNFKISNFLLLIVPFILFGIDFIGILPSVLHQTPYLLLVSIASALGAALFEETRDRGFGIVGFSQAIPNSKYKAFMIACLTSFLFSTTHYLNLLMPIAPTLEAAHQQVFYTFFMGMIFAVLYMRTGTIFYGILFHFVNNMDVWTPTSDLATMSPWGNLIIMYGLVPLIYTIWCLRPKKSFLNK